jgi:hypothetical protein
VKYLAIVAKAITAVIAVVSAAVLAGQLDVAPWVEVLLQAVVAGLGVYLVPNRPVSG